MPTSDAQDAQDCIRTMRSAIERDSGHAASDAHVNKTYKTEGTRWISAGYTSDCPPNKFKIKLINKISRPISARTSTFQSP